MRVEMNRLPHVLAGGDVIGDFTFADHATLVSHSLDKLPPGAMQLDEQRPPWISFATLFLFLGAMQLDEHL